MRLEDQCVSLELAKRLKELGVKQESLFCWVPGTKEYGYEGDWHFNPSDTYTLHYGTVEMGDIQVEGDYPAQVVTDEDNERWEKEDVRVRRQAKRLLKQVCSAFTVTELYKIHGGMDPHACYRFPEGIEPEKLADHIADEIIRLLENGEEKSK